MNAAALTPVLAAALLLGASATTGAGSGGKIRQSAVAGAFYPADPGELAGTVDRLLAGASAHPTGRRLVALICPHAGYAYSGHVAAESYALLEGADVNRVVVISPSHVEAFGGVSVYDGAGYATPLGVVTVDVEFAGALAAASPSIVLSGRGHDHGRLSRGEHALEVQLPFLQRVLGDDFRLVPVVMGDQRYETCRALGVALAGMIAGQPGTVVIASSDLSHFHPYDEARRMDGWVLESIQAWDYYSLSRNLATGTWEACGGGPIVAAMMASERLGADRAVLLKYANSGDVPGGDRERVVGYSAFAIVDGVPDDDTPEDGAPAVDVSPGGAPADGASSNGVGPGGAVANGTRAGGNGPSLDLGLTGSEKRRLLDISRSAVELAVRGGGMLDLVGEDTATLNRPLGAFVTLTKNGRLRGCIGYVVPMKPLRETVRDVAALAAVRDRRFAPVREEELADLDYEVSVLSSLRRVGNTGQVQVGRHGLLVKKGGSEGLLLPQVASMRGWDRITFLRQACAKAGLPPNAWEGDEADVFVFTAVVFGRHDVR